MILRLLSFLAGCVLLACGQQNAVYNKPYFDVDSLIDRQAHQLAAHKPRLHKVAAVDGRTEKKTWQPDSLQWAAELDVFRQLDDVNRPGLHNLYTSTRTKDTLSNLKVMSYRTGSAPLKWLNLYFLPHTGGLKKITAWRQESNALFTAHRAVALEFDDWRGQPRLARYTVQGAQKMVVGDSVTYQISGTVVY